MKLIHRTLDRVDVPRVPIAVSPDFRLTIVAGLVAIAGLVISTQGDPGVHASTTDKVLAYAGGAGFLFFGMLSIRTLAGEANRVMSARTGPGHAGILRWLILLVGYAIVMFAFLDVIQVKAIHQILIGGGIIGIVLGIAAQQSLGNLFAGVVLLMARPFNIGDRIRLKSGALGGELVGDVTGMGLTYVTLQTAEGPLSLPNSGVLAAGIGPALQPSVADAADPTERDAAEAPGSDPAAAAARDAAGASFR